MPPADLPDSGGQDLTPRQRKIVEVITDSIRRDGYSPTYREIGEAAGLASTSSVAYQVVSAREEGVPEPR
jgi:repressor LexA